MDVFSNVIFVSEFNAGVVDIRRDKLFGAMTLGPQAGCIFDCGIWFCTNSADYTIDCLGQPVNLSLYVAGKAWL